MGSNPATPTIHRTSAGHLPDIVRSCHGPPRPRDPVHPPIALVIAFWAV
ncbi:Hypothetical Protein sle_46180 [Streptomyces leeuwenhoekii]|uniref:Uncharacterized protein n=1 Tax=Streptomyces leeuwenhoekii TaxID=1437453 RepID=A0A0F7W4X9_STRLW|nr:Hypothetical Protein sle_46180 [Streptomyces leeuwenhoekii]